MMAAMAMNLFGHGMALSYDLVVQGAPSVSAKAAGITAQDILQEGGPLFLVMGVVTAAAAFLLYKKEIGEGTQGENGCNEEPQIFGNSLKREPESGERKRAAVAAAVLTPLRPFSADIVFLTVCDGKGSDATAWFPEQRFLLCASAQEQPTAEIPLGKLQSM